MSNPAIPADTLLLALPTSLSAPSSGTVACTYLSQTFQEDYFALISQQDTNGLTCSLNNGVLEV